MIMKANVNIIKGILMGLLIPIIITLIPALLGEHIQNDNKIFVYLPVTIIALSTVVCSQNLGKLQREQLYFSFSFVVIYIIMLYILTNCKFAGAYLSDVKSFEFIEYIAFVMLFVVLVLVDKYFKDFCKVVNHTVKIILRFVNKG